MRSTKLLAVCAGFAVVASVPATAADTPVPRATKQILLVVTPGWDATQGQALAFVHEQGTWRKKFGPLPVSIGRSGLAWGRGLHGVGAPSPGDAGPVKKEGDGRAPAGVFRLETALGYDRPARVLLPYRLATGSLVCVDDVTSKHYNRIVDNEETVADWNSAESMRRDDDLYRRVVTVAHNDPPVPSGGSCIFLHQRSGPGSTTAGCTAFDGPDIDRLFGWLDAPARPVLVQLPRPEFDRLRKKWGLPSID